ncbi:hypothetical protein CDAR_366371 [Caerostris darwini]|uniref:RNase H type-1 domain-containing protein n=1 Tax=Caerostris darwini TaxID=1538125 RepID=A0AAV4Q3Y8_9ARAC|nr:hypothetical protein CDAR_366371 [Caerostris darwini]
MDGLQFSTCVQPLSPPPPPLTLWKLITLYFLDLLSQVSKIQDYVATLLSANMETIYNRFPLDAWMHIYTEGPKVDINGSTRTGIFCEHFSHYLPLGTDKTTFDDEVEAIKVALIHLNVCPSLSEQFVIFSDSQAAILTIANCY